MKFFLDENFPKKAVEILSKFGYEVADIRGTELQGCDDTVIFKKAQENKAIFLTTDRDFFHTIPALYPNHHGVIVIALSQPNAIKILNKLTIAINYIQNVNIESSVLVFANYKNCLHCL